MNASFQGSTYDEALDGPRLTSQLERVKRLMRDQRWRTLSAIARLVGGSEAGVSARLRDLRKVQHGSLLVQRRRIGDSGLWEYRVWSEPAQLELIK
jgi:hypothetical protein